MKRMHVHVGVDNLAQTISLYSALFGTEPSVTKADYVKWTTCCYAKSTKSWIAASQGVIEKTFLTQGESTVYGGGSALASLSAAEAPCCEPATLA